MLRINRKIKSNLHIPVIHLNSSFLGWATVPESNGICVAFWKLFISTVVQGLSLIYMMSAWLRDGFGCHGDQVCIHLWIRWKPGEEVRGNVAICLHVSPTCLFMLVLPLCLTTSLCVKTSYTPSHTRLARSILVQLSESIRGLLRGHYKRSICVNNTVSFATVVLRWNWFLFVSQSYIQPEGSHQAVVNAVQQANSTLSSLY